MKRSYAFALLSLALAMFGSVQPQAQSNKTVVSIQGTKFLINGAVTHPGTSAEGMLLNSRMVQATFDDENSSTVGNWKYPDTGKWDPDRNTDEFVKALPSYRAKGMLAFTVNLQGGSPGLYRGNNQPNITTAFLPDGTLKPAWINRLDRVIRAADANGMVVIVGFFYFGQDHRLSNETAVIRAVDGATDWLLGSDYRNVLVEINNEADGSYDHEILLPQRLPELINRVKQRSGGTLKVSASLRGGSIPSDALMTASDYILLHGNGEIASGITNMVNEVRSRTAWKAHPKPILFNEDSTFLDNMDAAVKAGASWGLYHQGDNNYVTGFQSPPVNWTINTAQKQAFFDRVASWTKSTAPVGCQYALSPTSSSFGAEGGTGNVSVSTGSTCAWTATSNASWITITAGQSATGPASVKYSVGTYTGSSVRSGTLTIAGQSFTVTQASSTSVTQAVVSFTLINADTDLPVAGFDPLPDGATLNLSVLPTRNLTIRANTSPSIVGSVRFGLDGNSDYRMENDAPYSLNGDKNGDYAPWTLSLGSHVVTATPFSSSNGGGTAGTALSRQFTLVEDTSAPQPPKAPTNVRIIK